MVNDSDTQNLRIDISSSIDPQMHNIRGTPSPISSTGTPISPQITPASSNSPGSPNSVNSDHHSSGYFGLRRSLGHVSGEHSSRGLSDM